MALELFFCDYQEKSEIIFFNEFENADEKVKETFKIILKENESLIFKDSDSKEPILSYTLYNCAKNARSRNSVLSVKCESNAKNMILFKF